MGEGVCKDMLADRQEVSTQGLTLAHVCESVSLFLLPIRFPYQRQITVWRTLKTVWITTRRSLRTRIAPVTRSTCSIARPASRPSPQRVWEVKPHSPKSWASWRNSTLTTIWHWSVYELKTIMHLLSRPLILLAMFHSQTLTATFIPKSTVAPWVLSRPWPQQACHGGILTLSNSDPDGIPYFTHCVYLSHCLCRPITHTLPKV